MKGVAEYSVAAFLLFFFGRKSFQGMCERAAEVLRPSSIRSAHEVHWACFKHSLIGGNHERYDACTLSWVGKI